MCVCVWVVVCVVCVRAAPHKGFWGFVPSPGSVSSSRGKGKEDQAHTYGQDEGMFEYMGQEMAGGVLHL